MTRATVRLARRRTAFQSKARVRVARMLHLGMETLEDRRLLSASPSGFESIDLRYRMGPWQVNEWRIAPTHEVGTEVHHNEEGSFELVFDSLSDFDSSHHHSAMSESSAVTNFSHYEELVSSTQLAIGQAAVGESGVSAAASVPLASLPPLHSNPGAPATLYLDFDGHFESNWGAYSNLATPVYDKDGDQTSFSESELDDILLTWQRMSEDYSPFNIDVTTEEPTVLSSGGNANGQALRVVIGGSSLDWLGESLVYGISYISSFTNSIANTAYVFSDSLWPHQIGDVASHEAGHAFGLQHQSLYDASGTLLEEYHPGDATWAPIMGYGLSGGSVNNPARISTWHNGQSSLGPGYFQDDMSILSNLTNGFGYRADDHGNSSVSATPLNFDGTFWNASGIIERNDDVDVFSFTTSGGKIRFDVTVDEFAPDLDAVVELRDASNNLIAVNSPTDSWSASTINTLPAGTYSVHVTKASDYGRVGTYSLVGVLVGSGPYITTALPGQFTSTQVDSIRIAFENPINSETFTPDDVTLQGPNQLVNVANVVPVSGSGYREFEIQFETQNEPGVYVLDIGANIEDFGGSLMNQDQDEYFGEAQEDAFRHVFTITRAGSAVVLDEGQTAQAGVSSIGGVATDNQGNTYFYGSNSGEFDLDPSVGVTSLAGGFVAKYSSEYELLWVAPLAGANIRSADTDSQGNLYVTGQFSGELNAGSSVLVSNGSSDIFLAKISTEGEFVWAHSWGGTQLDQGFWIDVNDSDTVHLGARFRDTIDLDPGPATQIVSTAGPTLYGSALIRLDSAGSFLSASEFLSDTGSVNMRSVVGDDQGNSYAHLTYTGTLQVGGMTVIDEDGADRADVKIDAQGNAAWIRRTHVEASGSVGSSNIATDSNGNVYSVGGFLESVSFSDGVESQTLLSGGERDIYLAKWDASGSLVSVGQITGPSFVNLNQFAIDSNDQLYLFGTFNETADFDPSAGVANRSNIGGEDHFILRVDTDFVMQEFIQVPTSVGVTSLAGFDIDSQGNVIALSQFTGDIQLPTGLSHTTPVSTEAVVMLRLNMAPGITVTPTSGQQTSENGGTASFELTLDVEPTAEVTIALSSSDPSEGTVSPSQVTFTPANWRTPQTVTVTGVDDGTADGDVNYSILTSAAISADPGYNGLDAADIPLVNLDNEFTEEVVFNDSFESGQWNGKWVEDSQNDWFTSTQRSTDGSYSAEVDGLASNATLTVASAIDMSPFGSAEFSFDWLIESTFDSGEYLRLEFYNGASWNQILSLNGNSDAENVWHTELVELEPQYLVSSFQFRFVGKANSSNEDGNVDKVQLLATSLAAPPNQPPIANGDSYTVNEDGVLATAASGVLGNDSDADSDPLTAILVSGPTNGVLNLSANGSFTYTPASNFHGSDSFYYRANDGIDSSGIASVTIVVNAVNDAPDAIGQSVLVKESTPKNITLEASDPDGDALTYVVTSFPSSGVLSGEAPNLVYAPNVGFSGNDSFEFIANDGTVDSSPVTISITVAPNSPPIANAMSLSTLEDTQLAVTLSGSDADGDPLTYVVTSQPANGTLSGSAPSLVYTPLANFNGSDGFAFKVNDGTVDSTEVVVSINVSPVNDAPSADSQSTSTDEDAVLEVTMTGSDIDGDALSYSVVAGPSHGVLTGSGALRTYTPDPNYNGVDSFTFRTNDGSADSSLATITISIAPVNDAPVANPGSASTLQDVTVSLVLSGSDIDGDPVTYSIVTGPSYGSISGAGSNLSYTPNPSYVGQDSFVFEVSDGQGGASQAQYTITVDAAPSETVLFEDSFEVGSNSNDWSGNWVEDSQNDFFRSTQRATDGSRSAEVDGRATNAKLTLATPVDLSGYGAATLSFDWLIESGFDSGEFLSLDISTDGGSSWNQDVRRLSGNVSGENVWHSETVDLSGYASSHLLIRFRSTVSGSSEDANIDNVRIVATPASIAPAQFLRQQATDALDRVFAEFA